MECAITGTHSETIADTIITGLYLSIKARTELWIQQCAPGQEAERTPGKMGNVQTEQTLQGL